MKRSISLEHFAVAFAIAVVALGAVLVAAKQSGDFAGSGRWAASQLMTPEELSQELAGPAKPTVIAVTFKQLYDHAHVPGALYFGPGQNPTTLADLKQWAEGQAKDQPIVLYCGCCPWRDCPNIRPAFTVLKDMGFTKVRVVRIESDFTHEWCNRKFPVEASK